MWEDDSPACGRGRIPKPRLVAILSCDGITAYLKNGGKLEIAEQMANHESARTTHFDDRRNDKIHSMRWRGLLSEDKELNVLMMPQFTTSRKRFHRLRSLLA